MIGAEIAVIAAQFDNVIEALIKSGGFLDAVLLSFNAIQATVIAALFKRLSVCQENHVADVRDFGVKTLTAMETTKSAVEAMTTAVQMNGEVSKSQLLAMTTLKEALASLKDSIGQMLSRRVR